MNFMLTSQAPAGRYLLAIVAQNHLPCVLLFAAIFIFREYIDWRWCNLLVSYLCSLFRRPPCCGANTDRIVSQLTIMSGHCGMLLTAQTEILQTTQITFYRFPTTHVAPQHRDHRYDRLLWRHCALFIFIATRRVDTTTELWCRMLVVKSSLVDQSTQPRVAWTTLNVIEAGL